jgi:hypothetical protein
MLGAILALALNGAPAGWLAKAPPPLVAAPGEKRFRMVSDPGGTFQILCPAGASHVAVDPLDIWTLTIAKDGSATFVDDAVHCPSNSRKVMFSREEALSFAPLFEPASYRPPSDNGKCLDGSPTRYEMTDGKVRAVVKADCSAPTALAPVMDKLRMALSRA